MLEISNSKMKGHIRGIGVAYKNGKIKWYRNDIKVSNTITKSGLDTFMMCQNTPDKYCSYNMNGSAINAANLAMMFTRNIATTTAPTTTYNHGVLSACQRGLNGALSSSDMTDLLEPIGGKTYEFQTWVSACGTYQVSDDTLGYRVTHIHEAETAGQTIKEIGYYKAYATTAGEHNYTLFSRVALPQDLWVTLQPGERLVTTYQLDITNTLPFGVTASVGGRNLTTYRRQPQPSTVYYGGNSPSPSESLAILPMQNFVVGTNGIEESLSTSTAPTWQTSVCGFQPDTWHPFAVPDSSTSSGNKRCMPVFYEVDPSVPFPFTESVFSAAYNTNNATHSLPATWYNKAWVCFSSMGNFKPLSNIGNNPNGCQVLPLPYVLGSGERVFRVTLAAAEPVTTNGIMNISWMSWRGLFIKFDPVIEKKGIDKLVFEFTMKFTAN